MSGFEGAAPAGNPEEGTFGNRTHQQNTKYKGI
jgi:hypothetical protein